MLCTNLAVRRSNLSPLSFDLHLFCLRASTNTPEPNDRWIDRIRVLAKPNCSQRPEKKTSLLSLSLILLRTINSKFLIDFEIPRGLRDTLHTLTYTPVSVQLWGRLWQSPAVTATCVGAWTFS
ncbi:unnamed protein product, partial [Scytosiphon promiscuus]